jgi:hypothetical protein
MDENQVLSETVFYEFNTTVYSDDSDYDDEEVNDSEFDCFA